MKKFAKRIAAMGAAVMMMASISAMGVSAASSISGQISGYKTNGSVTCTSSGGSAKTSISSPSWTNVSATVEYVYVDTNDVTHTITKNGGTSSANTYTISASKPNTKYRSYVTRGLHVVNAYGQTWKNTSKTVKYY